MHINNLYISSLEQTAGSLMISMGMMNILKARFKRVAFFRPVIKRAMKQDADITFMLEHFSLDMEHEDTFGFYLDDVESMLAQDQKEKLVQLFIEKVKCLESKYDFIMMEGLPRSIFSFALDFDINLEFAKNIASPFVPVLQGKDKSSADILEEIKIEEKSIKAENCPHFATFVNRIDEHSLKVLQGALQTRKSDIPTYLLKELAALDTPNMLDVKEALHCKFVSGKNSELRHIVRDSKIAAMGMENYLDRIREGDLVIVSGDRADIIMGSLLSFYAKNSPNISGLILTGGLLPSEKVQKLLHNFHEIELPILSVAYDTYTTALKVDAVSAKITAGNKKKITIAMGLFESSVDIAHILEKFESHSRDVMTPSMFKYSLLERARRDKKCIVLPESEDERILKAVEVLLQRDIVDVILLGEEKEITYKASLLDVDISQAQIINPETSVLKDDFTKTFYELRRAKGLGYQAAQDTMTHYNYFATMMVFKGLADGMVSGATHTTGDTIRPAFQIIKTKPDVSLVSSLFFMCLDSRVLVYGDCAINRDPDAKALAQIAVSSAKTSRMFGIDPRVAMLSYSTGSSGEGEDVDKVRQATALVKEMSPELVVEGPIQYDAAIDEEVAAKKMPDSAVAGKASVFIFPDLNTGNNTYKAVQRSAGAIAIGPVLQGLKKPVNDLSRGCSVEDIIYTVAITAIQAAESEKE